MLPTPTREGRCRLWLGYSARTGVALRPVRGLVHRFIGAAYVCDIGRDSMLRLSLPRTTLPTPDEHFEVFGGWAARFMSAA